MLDILVRLEEKVGSPYEDWTPTIFNDLLLQKYGDEPIKDLGTEGFIEYLVNESGRVNDQLDEWVKGIYYNTLRSKAVVDLLGVEMIKELNEGTFDMSEITYESLYEKYKTLDLTNPITKAFGFLGICIYAEEGDVHEVEFNEAISGALDMIQGVSLIDDEYNVNSGMYVYMVQLYETIHIVNEALHDILEVELLNEENSEKMLHIELELMKVFESVGQTLDEDDE